MKKYAMLLFTALFLFVLSTNAQEQMKQKKQKGPNIENRVAKMATDLGLSDAEQVKVKALLEKHDAEKKKFNAENDKEGADFKQKMKELQKAQGAELKAVIGDEKYKKLQEIKALEKGKQPK